MLVVLNIGNTLIHVGGYEDRTLLSTWSFASDRRKTSDDLGIMMDRLLRPPGRSPMAPSAFAVCSVVPSLTEAAVRMGERYFRVPVFVVRPGVNTRIPIRCHRPEEVGADRIANAVAGYRKYRRGLIIVDCGTATTVDSVSRRGEFMGGAIAPGPAGLAEALYSQTAKLPKVDAAKPPRPLGKNTVDAMRSGLYFGYIGLVEGLVRRIAREMRGHPLVLSTGGLGRMVSTESACISHFEEFLTFEGVRILFEGNIPPGRF